MEDDDEIVRSFEKKYPNLKDILQFDARELKESI